MTEDGPWTIGELSDLVLRALHTLQAGGPVDADHADHADHATLLSAQLSKRVRVIPDERTIRWYSSIGLLDKPVTMRGRTALYGRRHLCQLVAVKRLQAQGRSLAQVQEDLLGLTDATLEGIAQLPANLMDTAPINTAQTDTARTTPDTTVTNRVAPRRAARFWAANGADADTVGFAPKPAAGAGEAGEGAGVVPAVRLGTGVTLLLGAATRPLNAEDLARLEQAAGPLLELLRGWGLDGPDPGRDA